MIVIDDYEVKVSGVILPGLFQSIEVDGEAQVDEIEVKGSSKRAKQIVGYEDAKIKLELILQSDENGDVESKIRALQNIFKKSGQQKPNVHEIFSKHTAARGITKVVFKKMTTKETNKTDVIFVTCEFWEYNSITVTTVKKSSKSSGTTSASVSKEYNDYLQTRNNKATKTPAIDSDRYAAFYESLR